MIVDAPQPEKRPPLPTGDHETDVANERQGGWIFLRALGSASRRYSVWIVSWLVLTLLGLAATGAWFEGIARMIGERYEHDTVIASLFRTFEAVGGGVADATFFADHATELGALKAGSAHVMAVGGLVIMLWHVYAAGGWLQVALTKKRGRYLRRFFVGGARYFGRFFRLFLVVLVLLSLLGWVLYGKPWNELVLGEMYGVPASDRGALETLSSEDTVVRLAWIQAGLYALGMSLLLVWARYTRTRIALHDTNSVVWNGLLTFFTLVRHPIRTLRPMILLFLLEAGVIALGAFGLDRLQGRLEGNADVELVMLIVFVAQALVAFRIVVHAARTFAAVRASQAVVRPLMRPDPWKSSVGGPGGPRYPIEDGDDEYAISV